MRGRRKKKTVMPDFRRFGGWLWFYVHPLFHRLDHSTATLPAADETKVGTCGIFVSQAPTGALKIYFIYLCLERVYGVHFGVCRHPLPQYASTMHPASDPKILSC
jgi:hypothetical protein